LCYGNNAIAIPSLFWQKWQNGQGTGVLMFETSYSVVERALVRTYDIPEKALGAFRGRLGNLQKQGIFGPKNMPGRGGRGLRYGPAMVHRMIFACELLEFGVSPAEVLDLIKVAWDRSLRKIFDKAEQTIECEPGQDDVIMHLGGVSMLKAGWSDTVPNVNSCSLRQLPDYVARWMSLNPDDPYPSNLPPRALIVNLSARLRSFHEAFADSHMRALAAEKANKSTDRPTEARASRRARKGK
jgi:hypothetical protein